MNSLNGNKDLSRLEVKFCCLLFFVGGHRPVPRTQKIMPQQCVDLLIADVGVLDPSEELDEMKELVQRKLLIVH